MDPTKLLEADHRRVEELFEAIEEAEGDERTPLIRELETSLHAHMELEEQVLYPAMAPVTGEEVVEEGSTEHELARKALADAVALSPDQPGFGAALDAVKAGIAHHVDEEEQEVFPRLRADGDVLERIVTPFMQTRAELGLPVDAAALTVASTRDELRDDARSAGIEGASSMTKAELADALVTGMGGDG